MWRCISSRDQPCAHALGPPSRDHRGHVRIERVLLYQSRGRCEQSLRKRFDHIYVEGSLVSTTYEKEFGEGTSKITLPLKSWHVKADSIRKLKRVGKAARRRLYRSRSSRRRFRSSPCVEKGPLSSGPFFMEVTRVPF